jgi:hypothetical protein
MPRVTGRPPIAPTARLKFSVVIMRMCDDTRDKYLPTKLCAIGSMTGKEYKKQRNFKSVRTAHQYFTRKAEKAGPNVYICLVRKASNVVIRAMQGRNTRASWMYGSVAMKC